MGILTSDRSLVSCSTLSHTLRVCSTPIPFSCSKMAVSRGRTAATTSPFPTLTKEWDVERLEGRREIRPTHWCSWVSVLWRVEEEIIDGFPSHSHLQFQLLVDIPQTPQQTAGLPSLFRPTAEETATPLPASCTGNRWPPAPPSLHSLPTPSQ